MSDTPAKSAPWFDFYPERFIAGTAIMELHERGAYITLLCHQWLAGSLPNDLRALSRLAGGDVPEAVLDKFPVCGDGKRRNAKLENVRTEQIERMQRNRGRAQKAASARWSPDAPSNAQAMLQASDKHAPSMPQAMLEPCLPQPSSLNPHPSTQVPDPVLSTVSASPRKRSDARPQSAMDVVAYGMTLEPALPPVEAQRFWDYYESNGWRVGRNPMKDWKAAVRNWQRNASIATPPQNGNHSRPHKPSSRNGEGFSLSPERRAWLDADKLDGPASHRD